MKTILIPLLFLLSTSAFAEKCCEPNPELPDDLYVIAEELCAHPYLNQEHPDDAATPGNFYYGEQRCIQANYGGGVYYYCNWNYGNPDCRADKPSSSKPKPNVSAMDMKK